MKLEFDTKNENSKCYLQTDANRCKQMQTMKRTDGLLKCIYQFYIFHFIVKQVETFSSHREFYFVCFFSFLFPKEKYFIQ